MSLQCIKSSCSCLKTLNKIPKYRIKNYQIVVHFPRKKICVSLEKRKLLTPWLKFAHVNVNTTVYNTTNQPTQAEPFHF